MEWTLLKILRPQPDTTAETKLLAKKHEIERCLHCTAAMLIKTQSDFCEQCEKELENGQTK